LWAIRNNVIIESAEEIVKFETMKLAVEYIKDRRGRTKAVQLPMQEWERLLKRLKKYEQASKIKSDLKEAFDDVDQMRKSKGKKKNLTEVGGKP
jgi:hypothetical protein